MKSLEILLKVGKVFKVLCRVVAILCIVGAVGCVIGLVSMGALSGLVIDGKTFEEIIMENSKLTMVDIYASCAIGIIACVGEAILFFEGSKYCKVFLEENTPFGDNGIKEMRKLGIMCIVTNIVISIVASIAVASISKSMGDVSSSLDLDVGGSIGMGLVFLLLSVIFEYGKFVASQNNNQIEQ